MPPKKQKLEFSVGASIPSVTLYDQDGTEHDMASIKGVLALFSYPKASTPGCTKQTRKFGEMYGEFEELDATVFGLSADSQKAQTTFRNKLDVAFSLLSDPQYELLEPLGAKKTPTGGVIRSHWVFKDGKCVFVQHGVKPDASPVDTLAAVKEALGVDDGEGESEDEGEGEGEDDEPKEEDPKDEEPKDEDPKDEPKEDKEEPQGEPDAKEDEDSKDSKPSRTLEASHGDHKVQATISGDKVKQNPEVVAKIASKVIAEVVTKASDVEVDPENVELKDKAASGEPEKLEEAKEDDKISGNQPHK